MSAHKIHLKHKCSCEEQRSGLFVTQLAGWLLSMPVARGSNLAIFNWGKRRFLFAYRRN